jgi:hypothetical protein
MPGNYDDIIREVLQSTSTKPTQMAGDVVPFPLQIPLLQDEVPEHFYMDQEVNKFPPSGKSMQDYYKSLKPANEANLGRTILRS